MMRLARFAQRAALAQRRAAIPVVRTYAAVSENQLTAEKLRGLVAPNVWNAYDKALKSGSNLPKAEANALATAVRGWAISRGCDKFAHVFYPAARGPAFKYNTFIDVNFGQHDWTYPLSLSGPAFSGNLMLFSETDGSSFPNGGMRCTHEAAAYLAWDRSSPMWIREDTLFIPSAFISWKGQALDEKTPLLRSLKSIDETGTRLLKLLGYSEVNSVVANVGCEQEFYVVDVEEYNRRPDLVQTGRTLIGRPAPNNQQLEDNYFAEPNTRVKKFFKDLQDESFKLGISFVVAHNEVGPSQHEWSPVFSLVNVAADQNNLAMRLMQDVANKHGLVCLLHEKPFAGINGSGKHNNWGLNTDTGKNLYVAGKNEKDEKLFMAMLATLARAVKVHGDIMRLGVATPANDHRLGAQEAPPAILSLYLGRQLTEFVEKVAAGGSLIGYHGSGDRYVAAGAKAVGEVMTAAEDRNRTAPFPWCGNRFEFRAVGGSQNVAWPLTCLQAAVADSMAVLADDIAGGKSIDDAVRKMLKDNIGSIFVGNGYDPKWHEEAVKKRGLRNIPTTPLAIDVLSDKKNIQLFDKTGIFTPEEVTARQEILYHNFTGVVTMEAKVLIEMMNTGLIPAMSRDLNQHHPSLAGERPSVYANVVAAVGRLQQILDDVPHDSSKNAAHYCSDTLKPAMLAVRATADAAEGLIAAELYPFPTYTQMLYGHHQE